MNMIQTDFVTPPAGVQITNQAEGLASLGTPGCAAAIWQREIPADVLNWLAALSPMALPRTRLVLRPAAVKTTVQQLCTTAGIGTCAHADWLAQDIATLAQQFTRIMQASCLRMRLDVIETNACRRFHMDAIKARLICTYRGTGTQYGTGANGADPAQIHTVPTGSAMVMRGNQWPETPASGLLHRSPPIEGTGETRLVLVLDPVDDLDTD